MGLASAAGHLPIRCDIRTLTTRPIPNPQAGRSPSRSAFFCAHPLEVTKLNSNNSTSAWASYSRTWSEVRPHRTHDHPRSSGFHPLSCFICPELCLSPKMTRVVLLVVALRRSRSTVRKRFSGEAAWESVHGSMSPGAFFQFEMLLPPATRRLSAGAALG
jgi:hypothetical protein